MQSCVPRCPLVVWPHVAVKHLKCSSFKLKCAVSVEYLSNFKGAKNVYDTKNDYKNISVISVY